MNLLSNKRTGSIFVYVILFSFLNPGLLLAQNQFGFNKENIDSSAVMQIVDTTRGLLIPLLSKANRDAISSPATGLLIYNTSTNSFNYYYGGWQSVGYDLYFDELKDSDENTQIQVEEGANEDKIRFDLGGTEHFVMDGAQLEVLNSGQSVFIGEGAGANDDLSTNGNVFIGYQSGNSNSTGDKGTAIGFEALYSNTTGTYNSAVGHEAMRSNTSGKYCTAMGWRALYANTTGLSNTAMGYGSAYSITTGDYNIAIGRQSLYTSTDGDDNIAMGHLSMYSNTTGYENVAIGTESLYSNTDAHDNIAVGDKSMYLNTTGSWNQAVGSSALYRNTEGTHNVAVGLNSLYDNTTGTRNVALGNYALTDNTTGEHNIAIGLRALDANTTGDDNIGIGYHALDYCTTGHSNVAIGYYALDALTSGNSNTALGHNAYGSGSAYVNSTALGYAAVISSSNQVRIGDNSVTTIGGYANWTNASDARFKTEVSEDVPGLRFITQLRPVTYYYDMDAIAAHEQIPDSIRIPESEALAAALLRTGFIAQEVENTAKELGFDFSGIDAPKTDEGHYGLRYATFVVPLVKAVQEQQEQLETLKNKNSELTTRDSQMQTDIELLKAENSLLRQEMESIKNKLGLQVMK